MKSKLSTKLLLLFLDALLLAVIFYFLTVIRTGSAEIPLRFESSVLSVVVIVWIVFYAINGYDSRTNMLSLDYTSQHLIAVSISMLITVFILYTLTFPRSYHFSRSVMFFSFLVFAPLSLVYRRQISSNLMQLIKNRFFLVLGSTEQARHFYRDYCVSSVGQELKFVDLTGEKAGQEIDGPGSPLIDEVPDSLLHYMDGKCDGIIIADGRINKAFFERLVNVHFNSIPVIPLETYYEENLNRVHIPKVSHMWLLEDGFLLVGDSVYDKVKRIADIAVSSIVLLLSSPLFLLLTILIRIDSRGPAIFRQERLGKDNTTFTLYKFRTMNDGSENGDLYTRDNDVRITRLGRLLRKWRLDELPQLWNVLKGEMSLIGPRAEWVKLTEEYEKKIPYYHFRHLVKPGITGWAQVNYPYGENLEDTKMKLEYDLFYIRRYSPLLDAKIVLKTIYVMLFGKGQ